MMKCNICPRNCEKSRINDDLGYCNVSNNVKIARASLHMWEEPCISGENGSGAVFFSGCNLGCVFCQNKEISRGQKGREISVEELSEVFLKLQNKGANNINLVTPTHYINQIIDALKIAKEKGLVIPIVYNTGAYERVETIKKLEGYIDVYLPDCKYYDNVRGIKYSKAPNYFDFAFDAIKEMFRQTGVPCFNEKNIMTKGVIIRHMILPEGTKDSKMVIEKLFKEFGNDVYYSLMSQYTPMGGIDDNKYPELKRRITKREYEKVVDFAIELGIENAFIQEGDVAKESFIPEWDF